MKRRQSYGSALWYLKGRSLTLRRYLNEFYPIHDWGIMRNFFFQNAIQGKVILNDYSKSNGEKQQEVGKIFINGKSKIVFIVGARGSGKTATAIKFAEIVNFEINRPIFYVSETIDEKVLPRWMKKIKRLDDMPKGSFGIIDESAIQYNSRRAMESKSKSLGEQLAIARHRDLFLIFITQHMAMTDTNVDRLKDLVLWKMSNDYSFGSRGKQTQEGKFWSKVRNMMSPRSKDECLFEYPAMRRFIHFTHQLPDCWSDELSKSWKDAQLNKKIESKILKEKEKNIIDEMIG